MYEGEFTFAKTENGFILSGPGLVNRHPQRYWVFKSWKELADFVLKNELTFTRSKTSSDPRHSEAGGHV